MTRPRTAADLLGRDLVDHCDELVGQIRDVLCDRLSGLPDWAVVTTQRDQQPLVAVPAHIVDLSAGDVRIPYSLRTVLASTAAYDPAGPWRPEDAQRLCAHYGRAVHIAHPSG